jgi:hypothetical protein
MTPSKQVTVSVTMLMGLQKRSLDPTSQRAMTQREVRINPIKMRRGLPATHTLTAKLENQRSRSRRSL